jgi:acylphosphatase
MQDSNNHQPTRIRVRVRISGRVLGVGFRYFTRQEARSLNVTGYVRNTSDGSVEAELVGPIEGVDRMLERLARGPALARVTAVQQLMREAVEESVPDTGTFEIRA